MPIISVTPVLQSITVVSGERYNFRNNGSDTVLVFQGTAAGTLAAPVEVFPNQAREVRASSTTFQVATQNGGTVNLDYTRNLGLRSDSYTLTNPGAIASGLVAEVANPLGENQICTGLTLQIGTASGAAATINVGFGPAGNATLDTTIFSGTDAAATAGTITVDSTTRVWPAASVLKVVRASGTVTPASVIVSGAFREAN